VIDPATNEPVSGFTRRECQDIYLDGFDIVVAWNGSSSLALKDTNRIKLRFFLYGKARLYSFAFERGREDA